MKSEGKIGKHLVKHAKIRVFCYLYFPIYGSQPAITCSKLTIETLEQGVKYVQS